THGVHVALMGDPTLRLHRVTPPSELTLREDGTCATLEWKPSPDADATYHVYYASEESGSYRRLTESPLRETKFVPGAAKPGVYMVRALRLETAASGSYVNASQGICTETTSLKR